MITNATRAICAMLSTIGTVGLVLFAAPTLAAGSTVAPAHVAQIAALPTAILTHG